MTPLGSEATVGVLGAGAMGSGIAQVAAAAGHQVMVTDARTFVRILHSIGPALRAFPFGKPEEPREPGPLATEIARVSGVALTVVAFLTLTGLLS